MTARARNPLAVAAGLALALAGPPTAGRADDGVSCPGGIVSVGDSRLDLLAKCGVPTLVEERPAQVTEWVGDRYQGFARTVTLKRETWTYDRGSSRLVTYVRLEAGKVLGVGTGGYGKGSGSASPLRRPVPRAPCDPAALRAGLTTYDLLSTCGEPVFRDVVEEQVSIAEGDGVVAQGATPTVERETWVYDFGPRALVRLVLVRDGRVTGVRTGGYGYSE